MLIDDNICQDLSDKELILRSLENMDYFACLYDRYEMKFLRYIKQISYASHEEAGDILQDAFIKIWKNLNSLDTGLKVSSWLFRIVHNETISYCRKKRSFGKNKKVNPEYLEGFPEEVDDPVDVETRQMLTYKVLEKLPLKYKEVLVLKYLEKMSYEEISDILKIPEGTVAVRINRAKKMFRSVVDDDNISFNM